MAKVILISTPYNCHAIVSLELATQLMNCKVYKEDGWGDNKKFTLQDSMEIEFIDESKLTTPTVQELAIEEILAENNRLSRLVEQLKAQIEPVSTSTDLVVEDDFV
jgi:hypothetical protein